MRKFLLLLPLAFLGLACEKDNSERCEGLRTAVKNDDIEAVKEIVNRLTADLNAQAATSADPDGHHNTYLTLIDRLNDECGLTATGACYACIDTYPPQSEIELTVPLGTHPIKRVIDLWTNPQGKFVCIGMHE